MNIGVAIKQGEIDLDHSKIVYCEQSQFGRLILSVFHFSEDY